MFRISSHKVASVLAGATLLCASWATAQTVSLAQSPLLTSKVATGLVMMTMGRDITLFRAAYNDVNDLDGDGVLDIHFKPGFTYDGYFASDRCYDYVTTSAQFEPKTTVTNMTPSCGGKWSGNFLNWLTMTRMDVIRKVLYGGNRAIDSSTQTVLERAYVPQDSTLWGKEYTSQAIDGYNIANYTPYPAPSAGRLMFTNATPLRAGGDSQSARISYYTKAVKRPMLFVYQNAAGRIWELAASDRGGSPSAILGPKPDSRPSVNGLTASSPMVVRVQTCVNLSGVYESGCVGYPIDSASPTVYKPTGVLQKYGQNKSLAFGLITGSYDNNYGGGVLRSNIDDFNREINAATGAFSSTAYGVVYHLKAMRPWGFATNNAPNEPNWDCGYNHTQQRLNGECRDWGNPLGEMMYEGLRYFSGASQGVGAYTSGVGSDVTIGSGLFASLQVAQNPLKSPEPSTALDLHRPGWQNPYATPATGSGLTRTAGYPKCSRATQLVIGNPSTSFDSDQLPGAHFALTSGFGTALAASDHLGTLDVSAEADKIWNAEFGGQTRQFFIGQSGTNYDGNPSAKTVSSFKDIRGHAPDDTMNQGSFYGASVARYGKATGVVNPSLPGTRLKIDQFSIALDSHVPRITVPMPSGSVVTLVPFSKSVNRNGYALKPVKGGWQPTDAITGVFVDSIVNVTGYPSDGNANGGRAQYKFVVNFSDSDQGSDNETDAQTRYELNVTAAGGLSVGVNYLGGGNDVEMHMGYVISGTTTDGVYLDVGAANVAPPPTSTVSPAAVLYYLDTPPSGATLLPRDTTSNPRRFTPGAPGSSAATNVPHDMLWYAAKHGHAGYDGAGNATDYFLNSVTQNPESYYFASNPSKLADQIGQAFQKAAALSIATTTGGTGTGNTVAGDSLVYVATFDSAKWGGDVLAKTIDASANIAGTPTWSGAAQQPAAASRTLWLGGKSTSDASVTTATAITTASYSSLSTATQGLFVNADTYSYLLGDRTKERSNGGTLRDRNSAFGDVVNSDPLYVRSADFGYTDSSYRSFAAGNNPKVVAVGSNDGFYRVLDADTGVERLAFMPKSAQTDIAKLAQRAYSHQYYTDGPSNFGHVLNGGTWRTVVAASAGAGGRSVFALDVTNGAAPAVLWEYTDTPSPDPSTTGNVLTKPIVGQLGSKVGVVLFGNGLNSTAGRATLTVLNALTGKAIRQCTPGNGTDNPAANGMTSIAFASTNNTGIINYVYAADYRGNIWRIDPNNDTCSSDALLVFRARSAAGDLQPITDEIAIAAAPAPRTGSMILFGTGSYLSTSDASSVTTQSLYGIWDDWGTQPAATRTDLVGQSIVSTGPGVRSTSSNAQANAANGGVPWFETTGLRGWFLDLSCTGCNAGERNIAKPLLSGKAPSQTAIFLTLVPGTDPCAPAGGAWLTTLDAQSGAYTKGFLSIVQNSSYIEGSAGRGAFMVPKTATSNNLAVSAIIVFRNISPGTSTAVGSDNTGQQVNGDGAGVGASRFAQTPPPSSSRLRRQVWRQIQ